MTSGNTKQFSGDAKGSRGTSFILKLETSQQGRRDAGYLALHERARNRPTGKGIRADSRSVQDIGLTVRLVH